MWYWIGGAVLLAWIAWTIWEFATGRIQQTGSGWLGKVKKAPIWVMGFILFLLFLGAMEFFFGDPY